MKFIKKKTIGLGIVVLLSIGSFEVMASSYIVQKGDTFLDIVYNKLKLDSLDGVSVPSGDINKIAIGDVITYKKKKKKKRFHKRKNVAKSTKFCFKDNHSIHYRAKERCK